MTPAEAPRAREPSLRQLRWQLWLAERLRPTEQQRTLVWAVVVGLLGALSSIAFRELVDAIQYGVTGRHGLLVEAIEGLPPVHRLLLPAAGGLVAGLVLLIGARLIRGPRERTDYMEAIVLGNGVVSTRASLVRCASACCSIASGSSIGREGPMVQLASMLASVVGRWRRFPAPRLRLLAACGAAAGIASVYNAPIAGALFAAEILLGTMAMELFGPLVLASVVATLTVRELEGSSPLYVLPPDVGFGSAWQIGPYLLLGILCGVLSALFLKLLRLSRGGFQRLPFPDWTRLVLGGLIVGALAVPLPQVCGNGFTEVRTVLDGKVWLPAMVVVILCAKVLATCASFGSGAVGGVFTPTLLLGATVGWLFGVAVSHHAPGFAAALDPRATALVGMGAFLAATTRAPMMAMIMLFEITLDYQIILPLMLNCVLATAICEGLEPNGIYAGALAAKNGWGMERSLEGLRVAQLMKPDTVRVDLTDRFSAIASQFIAHSIKYLYVVDDQGRFRGAIALHDVKNSLNNPDLADLIIARDILHPEFSGVPPDLGLLDALKAFAEHDGERLPVLAPSADGGPRQLLGSVSKTDVLLAVAGAWRR